MHVNTVTCHPTPGCWIPCATTIYNMEYNKTPYNNLTVNNTDKVTDGNYLYGDKTLGNIL